MAPRARTKTKLTTLSEALGTSSVIFTLENRLGKIDIELKPVEIFEADEFQRLQEKIKAQDNFLEDMVTMLVDAIRVRAVEPVTEQQVRRFLKGFQTSHLQALLGVAMTGKPPTEAEVSGEDDPKND